MYGRFVVLTIFSLSACSGAGQDETASKSPDVAAAPIVQGLDAVVRDAGNLNTLSRALSAAGLDNVLQGAGPFTVLAPTDDAFAKIPGRDLELLLANKDELIKVLSYHVLPGSINSSATALMTAAPTVEGRSLSIAFVKGNIVINGRATVTVTDIPHTKGLLHVVDAVLLPPKS